MFSTGPGEPSRVPLAARPAAVILHRQLAPASAASRARRRIRTAAIFLAALPALAAGPSAVDRAIAYLSREVPRWSRENACFSCHNNGDGARALFIAARRGWKVEPAALESTAAWLAAPEKWDSNRGDPAISDKKLARIQFAAALAESAGTPGLARAAALLVQDQSPAGAWPTDGSDAAPGSPVTYGTALATWLARRVAAQAGESAAVSRAGAWFDTFIPANHPDAAAAALASAGEKREAARALLRRGQNSDGGWGPYAGAPSEPFDTAVALLALADSPPDSPRVARGRDFLKRTQLENGGWPATTRPSGGQSYAQHISTTAWSLIALIETAP
jgi:hypothetical protein